MGSLLTSEQIEPETLAAGVSKHRLEQFVRYCEAQQGRSFSTYSQFDEFSANHFRDFWAYFLNWSGIQFEGQAFPVCVGDDIETAEFFPGVRLNFAENFIGTSEAAAPERRALTVCRAQGKTYSLTRGELRQQVIGLANALKSLGLNAQSRVGMIAENDDKAVIAALGTAAIGAVIAPAPPEMAAPALIDRFLDVSPQLLFCNFHSPFPDLQQKLRERIVDVAQALPSLTHIIALDDGMVPEELTIPVLRLNGLTSASHDHHFAWERFPFSHPLMIVFTSGTTGRPKCLVHSVGGELLEWRKEMLLHYDVGPNDKVFLQASTGWTVWNMLMSAVGLGVEIVLNSRPISTPEVLWQIVADERVTLFGVSPAYLRMCENHGYVPREHFDFSALKAIITYGSILDERHLSWVRAAVAAAPVKCQYGASDVKANFYLASPDLPLHGVEIQSRSLGLDVRVIKAGELGFPGPIGEVVIARPFPSRPVGMLNDPDGSRFHQAYFAQNPGYWTQGDLMEITPRGGAIVHGRSDGVINFRGIRIGPAEIYRVVMGFGNVANTLVVTQRRPELPGGECLVLLVTLVAGCTLDAAFEQDLKDRIRQNLSPNHVPDVVVQVPDLPITINGKLSERSVSDALNGRIISNLHALRNPECLEPIATLTAIKQAAQESSALELPATSGLSALEIVVAVWETALKRTGVKPDDDFFDLGGDSLSAVQILLDLEKAFGKKLPLTILYEKSTPAALAPVIGSELTDEISLLVKLKDGTLDLPLFMFHGISGHVMELHTLCRRIAFPGAIFGVQAKGAMGECEPLRRIEDMARTYADAILAVHPTGPYLLAGYSLGGQVSIEVAGILASSGQQVAEILMIDPAIEEKHWPIAVWIGMLGRRMLDHVTAVRKLPISGWLHYAQRLVKGVYLHLVRRYDHATERLALDFTTDTQDQNLRKVHEANVAAVIAYLPHRFEQPVHMIIATDGLYRASDPVRIWRPHAKGGLSIETVPGNHASILLPPDCDRLAAAISARLRRISETCNVEHGKYSG